MSSDKPSQRRRGRSVKKSPEDPESGNAPMDIDPTESTEKDASKGKLEEGSAEQPSGSYEGVKSKVQSQKSKEESDNFDSIRGTIVRAVEILESTSCRRREEFRENQRMKKIEQNVTRYLGPGWVDTLIQDEPWVHAEGSITDRLRKLAREILISEFERRRSERKEDLKPWIPVAYRLAEPRIPCPLSDEPVECEFDDDFEIELDTDLDLPLQIKLPDPSKKSPESPKKPKEGGDEPPPDAPSGAEQAGEFAAGYRGRNIPSYLFIPYFQFAPREQGGQTSQETYAGLDEIYERYGANTWRMYASAAYQTGRYHTEEQLRIARERMDDRNITDENYRDWYHAARRGTPGIDEDTTIERPELEARLMSYLITMEKITSAMLYIDIFRELERREEEGRRVEEARRVEREARARMVTDSDHSSDSYSTALASDIVEDYIQERTRLVYERLVNPEEAEGRGISSEKYPSALASGSSTSSPLEVQSPDVISPGDVSGQGVSESTKSSIRAPSVDSRSDPTSEKGLLRSFETTSTSSKDSSSFKTGSSSGEKLKSRVASLEKSESFESTSRSISPLPLDTEMSEEENVLMEPRIGAQANFMGHVAVAGLLQSIEAAILQEESEMEVQPELSEETKSEDSKELSKEKEELAKRKERRSKDPGETDSKRPHMG